MRKITAEERDLFLAALAGNLPAKAARAVAKAIARKAVAAAPPAKPTGRRKTTDEEVLLFLEAIGLRTRPAPVVVSPPPKPAKTAKGPGGLDGGTKRKLDKGEVTPTTKLDLHGLTEAAAHASLLDFIAAAHARGDRLVLVVTGKGERGRGVLKAMVPRWLDEPPLAKLIADKRSAHRRHGGEGALYVYLRKPARTS